MKGRITRRGWRLTMSAVVVLAAFVVYTAAAAADSSPAAPAGTALTPSGTATVQMSDAYNPWTSPTVNPPAGQSAPAARPTVSDATLAALKSAPSAARPGASPSGAAITLLGGFNGAGESVGGNPCGCYPPDTNAAVSGSQILEIVNSQINVYSKTTFALQSSVSINTFFGYGTTLLFDPRVLYDESNNRWLLEAEGFQDGAGNQFQFFAASTGSNAAGTYRKFALNMSGIVGSANFWDYPQIGQNSDGIIFTGNVFGPSSYLGATTFQFSKDSLENATSGGSSSFVYSGLGGTTTPPNVIDRNWAAHMLTVPTSGSALGHTYWSVPGHDLYAVLVGAGSVGVAAYSPPPGAPQPGTGIVLDTLDARIVNDPAQIGSSLFAVHSINVGGAAWRWYEINTSNNSLVQQQNRFRSGSSADFEPSLAIDVTKRMVICGTTSDAGTFPSSECIGRNGGDPASTTGAFNVVFGGSTSQTGNGSPTSRWGDTSSVSVDKYSGTTTTFWTAQEQVDGSGTLWTTRISKVKQS